MSNYQQLDIENGVPVKMWTNGVPVEEMAIKQLSDAAQLAIIFKHIAVMPDVHVGKGATIGSVIPTVNAIIPAAVGVDIGCGMMAVKTSLMAEDLPDNLAAIRSKIEQAIPHGRSSGRNRRDHGAWHNLPATVENAWLDLVTEFKELCDLYPNLEKTNNYNHLGTLGTGNHFVEVCLDEHNSVWLMLHSGSRGVGNAIGAHFINLAKKDAEVHQINLPNTNLAYLQEGSQYFDDYVKAVGWAQKFALKNREVMMNSLVSCLRQVISKPFATHIMAVNCHHNYVQKELHFGAEVFITRKGAVSAKKDELGIIPGSMGARSFIVRGLGNAESFHSCSHGAGRKMSRTAAKNVFTLEDHIAATKDVECRKDAAVIDETPMAYKDIDAVMKAQSDLVEIVHTLKQIICVKG